MPEWTRYWYSHAIALRQARDIAAETGQRQRVQRCDPAGNRWRCKWQIVDVEAEPCS